MFRKLVCLGVCLLAATPALAADWPMWGGTPGRNMVNTTEKKIPVKWDIATGMNIKWRARLGSQSYGNPTIADGKVFVGTNNDALRDPEAKGDKGIVMCFRESDGEFLWQATHDKMAAGRVNDWPEQGICSTVFVDGKRVYYVSNECQLVCADTEGFMDGKNDGPFTKEKYTGKKEADFIWVLNMMEELGVFPHNLSTSSPVLVGDKIFLITSNGVDEGHVNIPSPKAPSFICVNKNTGEVIWDKNYPGKGILHGQWSSPAYGVVNGKPQVFFPGGDGWVYALNPDNGEIIWKFDCNPPGSVYILGGKGTKNEIIATPVFVDNKVFIDVGQDPEHGIGPGHYYCIDATKTGDVTTPGKLWQFDEITRSLSSSAVSGDHVYVSDLNGFLYCMDVKTGKLLWKHDTLAAVWGSPTVIDGKVYLGDEDGDVLITEDSREKKVIGENSMGNAVYTTSVAANGVLYIANRNELFAIAEGASYKGEPK